MRSRTIVVERMDPVSEGWLFTGRTNVHGECSYFQELTGPERINLLSGSYEVKCEVTVLTSPLQSVWTVYAAPVGLSRRQAMLDIIERLQVLKSALREKYGEFNIEEDLEEMRKERLAGLG